MLSPKMPTVERRRRLERASEFPQLVQIRVSLLRHFGCRSRSYSLAKPVEVQYDRASVLLLLAVKYLISKNSAQVGEMSGRRGRRKKLVQASTVVSPLHPRGSSDKFRIPLRVIQCLGIRFPFNFTNILVYTQLIV